jgi:glycosyltransferase involved in cell wall biosynthesis
MKGDRKTQISVIVPVYNAELTIERCLNSLINQKYDKNYEIIVIDSSSDRTGNIIREKFKEVRYVKLEGRAFPGKARNTGIGMAKGEIISFIDSDCIAEENWLDSIRNSFKGDKDAAGGSVGIANRKNNIALAEYILEFSDFLPAAPRRLLRTVPMCNISYRKEIFEKYGLIPDIRTAQEVVFNWGLFKKGVKIHFNPDIKIRHIHREKFSSFMHHQYLLGRGYVESRLTADLPGRILLRYPFKALLPVIRLTLIMKRLLAWDRKLLLNTIRLWPVILLGMFSWVGGAVLYGFTSPEDRASFCRNPYKQ